MSSAAAHLPPTGLADQNAEDVQHYRRVLHELIDMGMDLARAVHQQGTAEVGGNPGDGPGVMGGNGAAAAFDRISRAIRRTIALARKVAEPLPPRGAAGPGQHRVAARMRIIREVEDVIQRTVDGAEAEALGAELSERMDSPDVEDELDQRSVAEIIADICRDLGIASQFGNHPWKRRTPRDIEALCARAAQPRAAPSPSIAHAAPSRSETDGDPPSVPRDAGAELLRFTFPVRGT